MEDAAARSDRLMGAFYSSELADYLARMGRHQEALKAYAEGRWLKPGNVYSYLLPAHLHVELGQYQEAIALLERASHLRMRGCEDRIRLLLGQAWRLAGDSRRAVEVLTRFAESRLSGVYPGTAAAARCWAYESLLWAGERQVAEEALDYCQTAMIEHRDAVSGVVELVRWRALQALRRRKEANELLNKIRLMASDAGFWGQFLRDDIPPSEPRRTKRRLDRQRGGR